MANSVSSINTQYALSTKYEDFKLERTVSYYMLFPIYLGMLCSSLTVMLTLGIVVSTTLGRIWDSDPMWRYGCIVGGLLSVLELSVGFTLLESPTWLHGEDRHEEANENMTKLRGDEYQNSLEQHDDDQRIDDMATYEYTVWFC